MSSGYLLNKLWEEGQISNTIYGVIRNPSGGEFILTDFDIFVKKYDIDFYGEVMTTLKEGHATRNWSEKNGVEGCKPGDIVVLQFQEFQFPKGCVLALYRNSSKNSQVK